MDAVTKPLAQKEYSSEKIDLRVWRRLIAYAMRRKSEVGRLACVLLVVSSIDILYPVSYTHLDVYKRQLVATLPVYLNALTGKGVHVVTVNDYLAKRD